jgi:hypothetical protein
MREGGKRNNENQMDKNRANKRDTSLLRSGSSSVAKSVSFILFSVRLMFIVDSDSLLFLLLALFSRELVFLKRDSFSLLDLSASGSDRTRKV